MSASRQLILCTATGYTWPQVAPFVRSLRGTGFGGDVMMLIDRSTPEHRRKLTQSGISLRGVWSLPHRLSEPTRNLLFNRRLAMLYRLWPALCDALPASPVRRRRIKAWLGQMAHHIACCRYFHYYAFLLDRGSDYDEIMLSDVRDVIFQANPFSRPLHAPQRFFIEHPSLTVGGQINNAMWVGQAYGEAALRTIAHRPVSCSGISYGTTAGMLDYLAAMCDDLLAATHRIAGHDGYDQGVHNWLIWTGRFPDAEIAGNTQGPVLTLQGVPPAEIRTDARGCILDQTGAVMPVLHQYDRHPEHAARLESLFA